MKKTVMQPGRPARACAVCLAFILALTMTLTTVLGGFLLLSRKPGLYTDVLMNETLTEMRMKRIDERLEHISAQYGFQADTVRPLITAESLNAYVRQVSDWFCRFLRGNPVWQMPEWNGNGLTEAILQDPGFISGTEEWRRTGEAANAAYAIINAVTGTVLPLRSDLMNPVLEKISEKVDLTRIVTVLPTLFWLLCCVAFLCTGLQALLLSRRLTTMLRFTGAAFGATALLMILSILPVLLANFPGMLAEVNQIASVAAGMLQNRLLCLAGLAIIPVFAVWLVGSLLYVRLTGRRHS